MASNFFFLVSVAPSIPTLTSPLPPPPPPPPQGIQLQPLGRCRFPSLGAQRRKRRRREAVVTNAGPPSSTTLLIAFVLPLSLIAGTVFASIRIADALDQKYLEELAMTRAASEENEGEEGDGTAGGIVTDGEGNIVLGEKEDELAAAAAVPRLRNRPRRRS